MRARLVRGEAVETVFASPTQFLVACLILACAEAIYVLLGFGAGLIAVGALALLMPDLQDVVVLPELFRTPYFCQREDPAFFDLAEPVPGVMSLKYVFSQGCARKDGFLYRV